MILNELDRKEPEQAEQEPDKDNNNLCCMVKKLCYSLAYLRNLTYCDEGSIPPDTDEFTELIEQANKLLQDVCNHDKA